MACGSLLSGQRRHAKHAVGIKAIGFCENSMLRTNAPAPLVEREQVSPGDSELGEVVDLVWVFLRRQYSVILSTALLAIAAAVIYLRAG